MSSTLIIRNSNQIKKEGTTMKRNRNNTAQVNVGGNLIFERGITMKKKLVSVILTLIMAIAAIPLNAMPVFAAAAFPSLSSSAYCEFTATKDIPVYRDKNFKTRGTSSPARNSSTAEIWKGDVCKIIAITSTYIQLQYPTSSGTYTGYIKRSALISVSAPVEKVTNKGTGGNTTTYISAGGKSYGYTAKGDAVFKLGISGNYTSVIYTAKSGKRAYKLGWVLTSEYNSKITSTTTPPPAASTMTNALYKINVTSSKITCHFDGYINIKGRHEGIDFAYGRGKSIHALLSGEVTRVTEGKNGTGNGTLSTVAIYNKSLNKTIIYLHVDPISLYVGKQISKGEKIAEEANRGTGSVHTHVEVRNGHQTAAVKSVDDYKLENSNPASFWKSQGYTIK